MSLEKWLSFLSAPHFLTLSEPRVWAAKLVSGLRIYRLGTNLGPVALTSSWGRMLCSGSWFGVWPYNLCRKISTQLCEMSLGGYLTGEPWLGLYVSVGPTCGTFGHPSHGFVSWNAFAKEPVSRQNKSWRYRQAIYVVCHCIELCHVWY